MRTATSAISKPLLQRMAWINTRLLRRLVDLAPHAGSDCALLASMAAQRTQLQALNRFSLRHVAGIGHLLVNLRFADLPWWEARCRDAERPAHEQSFPETMAERDIVDLACSSVLLACSARCIAA